MVECGSNGTIAKIKGDEFLVGTEIKVTETDKIRRLARCISSNIMITSNMSKSMYDRYLEPAVGKFLGMVDMHLREILWFYFLMTTQEKKGLY